MKKILILSLFLIFHSSCKKEEVSVVEYTSPLFTVIDEIRYNNGAIKNDSYNGHYIHDSDYQLLNWIFTDDVENFCIKNFQLNLKGEDVSEINQDFLDRYNSYFSINEGFPSHSFDSYFYCYENFCTLITRNSSVAYPGAFHLEFYNIDKKQEQILTNEELISLFGMEEKELEELLNVKLEQLGISFCDVDSKDNCAYQTSYSFFNPPYYPAQICEDSVLYVNENGKLEIIVYVENPTINPYHGSYPTYLVPIQLTD